MNIKTVTIPTFNIIGTPLRTSNLNNRAATEIGPFWQNFFAQNIPEKIPNKINAETIYGIYTDYDATLVNNANEKNVVPDDYTLIASIQTSNLDTIPQGMIGKTIPTGTYAVVPAQGPYPLALISAWEFIWSADFPYKRAYTFDFEKYDNRFTGKEDSYAEIYIAVRA